MQSIPAGTNRRSHREQVQRTFELVLDKGRGLGEFAQQRERVERYDDVGEVGEHDVLDVRVDQQPRMAPAMTWWSI